MAARRFGEWPFVGMVILVGVLTAGLILLGDYLGLGLFSYLLLVFPIGLAVGYLARYESSTPRGGAPAPAPPDAAPVEEPPAPEEPFEDPVEEADRLDRFPKKP